MIARIDVDRNVSQLRDGVEHRVAGLLSDLVGRGERLVAVGGDPAPRHGSCDRSSAPGPRRPPRTPGHSAGRRPRRDRSAPARSRPSAAARSARRRPSARSRIATVIIRPTSGSASGKPSQTPTTPDQHRQRGQAVRSGVVAVGHQRGAADALAGPNPVLRAPARCPKQPTTAAAATQPSWSIGCGWSSFCERLPGGNDRRRGDHQHDEDAGQVLGPPVAVGVARVGGRRPSEKASQSGIAVGGVGKVMDRVGQQRRRAADQDDDTAGARRSARARSGESLTARIPAAEPARASSTLSAASWLCG